MVLRPRVAMYSVFRSRHRVAEERSGRCRCISYRTYGSRETHTEHYANDRRRKIAFDRADRVDIPMNYCRFAVSDALGCIFLRRPHLSVSLHFFLTYLLPYLFFPLRIDPLSFQAGCRNGRLNMALVFFVFILCCSTFLLISKCVLLLC